MCLSLGSPAISLGREGLYPSRFTDQETEAGRASRHVQDHTGTRSGSQDLNPGVGGWGPREVCGRLGIMQQAGCSVAVTSAGGRNVREERCPTSTLFLPQSPRPMMPSCNPTGSHTSSRKPSRSPLSLAHHAMQLKAQMFGDKSLLLPQPQCRHVYASLWKTLITFQPDLLPVGGAHYLVNHTAQRGKIILSLTILKSAQQGHHGEWARVTAGP